MKLEDCERVKAFSKLKNHSKACPVCLHYPEHHCPDERRLGIIAASIKCNCPPMEKGVFD